MLINYSYDYACHSAFNVIFNRNHLSSAA
uniref:Uncharacterized protein n=1 Tax=Anguilla anguilla TaxID=7936 RepID=A0A0E9VE53_ANGAN